MSLEALDLDPSATTEDVKAAYRKRAATLHPDRGGNADEFDALNKAYRIALDEVSSGDMPCTVCGGTGLRPIGHGFSKIMMPCLNCCGAKRIPRVDTLKR